jgi:hypothetical protein
MKLVDTAGRIDKFKNRYEKFSKKSKTPETDTEAPEAGE